MKPTRTVSVIASAAAFASSLLAGPLDPPSGPIAPSGKTLIEVEPRIAVNTTNTPGTDTAQFRITQPGSYYLTGNITGASGKNGILIASNGVTLDLNGFSLLGVAGSLDGIAMVTFLENIVIRNGHVRDWGGSGIETRIDIGRIEGVTAADNGGWGIDNSTSGPFTTVVTRCEAINNGTFASGAGNIRAADNALISWCVSYNAVGAGISVGVSSIVDSCIAYGSSGSGITTGGFSSVRNCVSNVNANNGIVVAGDCLVLNNLCRLNGLGASDGAGILVSGSDCHIEGNLCTDADRGIDVDGSGNFITRNTCSGNLVNWDIAGSNVCFVINANVSPAFSGSFGGTAPGSSDPNANFSF